MARVCNIGYSTRLLKKSSAIERPNKGGFRSESILALSVQSHIGALELDLPQLQRVMTGHTVRVLQDALGFGVFSGSTGFLTPNLEIWTISSSFASPIDQIDLYPVKRLILRAQIEHQSCKPIGRDDLACHLRCCAGSLRRRCQA